MSSVEPYPRGDAPKGKTPSLVLSQSTRERLNLMAAIPTRGPVRFRLYRDPLPADPRIQFLERLIREAGRKLFLSLDNLRVHPAAKVKTWLGDKTEQIERCFLPSDSPQLNPDESVNADLTAGLNAAKPLRGSAHLKRKGLSPLRSSQKQPARVRSYFKADPSRSAA